MKHQKRFLMLLIVCLLVTFTSGVQLLPNSSAIANAAVKQSTSKIKLSKTNETLYVGDTTLLKLSGAKSGVTWYSSNPYIASVNEDGRITALKAGSAKITAAYQKKTYTCKVKVLPEHIRITAKDLSCTYKTKVLVYVDSMGEQESIDFEVQDPTVLSCKWNGSFGSKHTNTLLLTPLRNGSTKITLSSDESDHKVTFTVHVSGCNADASESKTDTTLNMTQLSPTELYSKCIKSMVQLDTDVSIGSGFFLDDSTIVTNYHVIQGASQIEATTYDDNTYLVKKVLGYDKTHDIAILSIDGNYDYLPVNTHGLTVGESVYTIGSPLGFSGTFTNGMITYNQRFVDSTYYVQTNAAFSSGNSGGPLLNAYGEVVGINTLSYTFGQNLNLSVDIAQIYAIDIHHPMTVREFLKKNPLPVYVDEDPDKSSSKETAQAFKLGDTVVGTSDGMESFKDYYKINITEANDFLLEMHTDSYTPEELAKLWICIVDVNGSIVDHIVANNTTFLSEAELTPGTYYILVYPNSKQYKADLITYYFTLTASVGVG